MTSKPELRLVTERRRQYYDPYHLIDEVEALLRRHGLRPERIDSPDEPALRLTGASQLLRGLGIFPAATMEDHRERHEGDNDIFRDHGEPLPDHRDVWPR